MSSSNLSRAMAGEDLPVDFAAIERDLAELWRTENEDPDHAVTRAALWNVIAHAENDRDRTMAGEILAAASATVPQRTILVRADPAGDPEIAAWISANCHMLGGEKQVCSEEITIVAGGRRIYHVPPLVDALLLPELPVAAWWVGDLPHDREDYILALLSSANRLILDSAQLDTVDDLTVFARLCANSNTFPADLNWERLEEWRLATASVFDPQFMRPRLRAIQAVRIVSGSSDENRFGEFAESFLYAAWIAVQLGYRIDREGFVHGSDGPVEFKFEHRRQSTDVGAVAHVEIQFSDGSSVVIERDRQSRTIRCDVAGLPEAAATIRPLMPRGTRDLIVRQLSHMADDRVFRKVLGPATLLARRALR